MKLPSLREAVGPEKKVHFAFYRDGELWYSTDCGFEFPIPREDMQGATFLRTDKSVYFMRFIQKHINFIRAAQKEQSP